MDRRLLALPAIAAGHAPCAKACEETTRGVHAWARPAILARRRLCVVERTSMGYLVVCDDATRSRGTEEPRRTVAERCVVGRDARIPGLCGQRRVAIAVQRPRGRVASREMDPTKRPADGEVRCVRDDFRWPAVSVTWMTAALLVLAGCRADPALDVTLPEAGTPDECASCPGDCCRLADGGVACLNWNHRNALTLECRCGTGSACAQPAVCCSPASAPWPQLPPSCVALPSLCDPRPQP